MNLRIVVYPTKEVQDFANPYRKRYDPHYRLIQPNITLRELEGWPETRVDEVVRRLETETRPLKPFTLTINRFSSLFPVANLIYLALEDPEPMNRMYQRLGTGWTTDELHPSAYTPLLTVARDLSDEELHDVFAGLRKQPVHFEFSVDRVHLLYQTENQAVASHRILEKISLYFRKSGLRNYFMY